MNLIYRTLVRRTPRPGKMLTPRPPPWLRSIRWSITFIFFAALFFNGCYSEIWPWREHLWLCGTRAGSVQVGNCYSSWWSSDHWSSWLLGMMITWKSPVQRHWRESSCTVTHWPDMVIISDHWNEHYLWTLYPFNFNLLNPSVKNICREVPLPLPPLWTGRAAPGKLEKLSCWFEIVSQHFVAPIKNDLCSINIMACW